MLKAKRNIILSFLCGLACIALVLSISISYAKYIGEKSRDVVASGERFFFTSNLLSSDGTALNVNGGNAFTIELRNYENNNFTTSDITFSLAITNGTATGGSPESGLYTLSGGAKSYLAITITPSALDTATTVTATATVPYSRILSGSFSPVNTFTSYNISAVNTANSRNILYLQITTAGASPTITLVWDTASYSHDNTNELFVDANISCEGTIASYTLPTLSIGRTYSMAFIPMIEGTSPATAPTLITTNTQTITLPTITP